jgi:hypothetical protein
MLDTLHDMNATSAPATGERARIFNEGVDVGEIHHEAPRSRLSIVLWPLRATGRSRDQRAESIRSQIFLSIAVGGWLSIEDHRGGFNERRPKRAALPNGHPNLPLTEHSIVKATFDPIR